VRCNFHARAEISCNLLKIRDVTKHLKIFGGLGKLAYFCFEILLIVNLLIKIIMRNTVEKIYVANRLLALPNGYVISCHPGTENTYYFPLSTALSNLYNGKTYLQTVKSFNIDKLLEKRLCPKSMPIGRVSKFIAKTVCNYYDKLAEDSSEEKLYKNDLILSTKTGELGIIREVAKKDLLTEYFTRFLFSGGKEAFLEDYMSNFLKITL
jgi:hypothetical protein